MDGVSSFGTNVALIPARLAKVQAAVGRDPALLSRFGVCFATVDAATTRTAVAQAGGVALVRLPCAPRVSWTQAVRVDSPEASLEGLRAADVETRWEGAPANSWGARRA